MSKYPTKASVMRRKWTSKLTSYDEWHRVSRKEYVRLGGDGNPNLLRTRSPYGKLYWSKTNVMPWHNKS
jgi:hypothetical protein